MQAMVVDDSRAMRLILRRFLTGLGFEVTEAGSGVEAFEALSKGPAPQLVLVDRHMPEMDGLELLERVRAEPAYADMVMVMVTSESDHGEVTRALDAGADEYVTKPFTPDQFQQKLERLGLLPVTAAR